MTEKIRVGIIGYGNLGKGIEEMSFNYPDLSLEVIFTKRDPKSLDTSIKAEHMDNLEKYVDKIDVMLLCGGSATDLPNQGPLVSNLFNTVDSYDNHNKIPEYFETMDKSSKLSNKTSLISTGWDPGLFSLNRLLSQSILPKGDSFTFWGKGVSQGHSQALRRIKGVEDAVQYTVPSQEAINLAKNGKGKDLTTRDKHDRICYLVLEEGADKQAIEKEIVAMPYYFADYNTQVNFISQEKFDKNHRHMPHGGFVIQSYKNEEGINQVMEFSLKLDNNPLFTASVLLTYARAVYRLNKEGKFGAFSVFDIPLSYLSDKSSETLRKELL